MPDSAELPAILLLNKTSLLKKSFARLLNGRFVVLHVETAEQAWEILQNKATVSLLVSDLDSAVDESALVERIRRSEDKILAILPVLLLVGERDQDDALDKAFSAGATDFIYMPFSSDELITRVQLHSRHFEMTHDEPSFELASQNSPVDLLNTLVQEKYFYKQLEKNLSFSTRHMSYVSVCQFKIDNAESIEQEFGKPVLRAVLRAVAKLLEQILRREDIFAYIGDETFCVMYPLTNALGAHVATHRLQEKIQATHLKHEGQEVGVSLSMGFYSTLPTENMSVEQIMIVLEQRLEKALQQGGGKIVSGKTDQEKGELSLEQAFNMISFNRGDEVDEHIPGLTGRLITLLNYIHKSNQLEFNRILDEIDEDS